MSAAAALLAAGALVSCGRDGADPQAFCTVYAELRDQDPFDHLDVASPAEMRSAFDQLRRGAVELARTAPQDAEVQADRYRAAVDDLVDQLRGAGYDLRALDLPGYRQATDAYNQAAVSLENAAGAACD